MRYRQLYDNATIQTSTRHASCDAREARTLRFDAFSLLLSLPRSRPRPNMM